MRKGEVAYCDTITQNVSIHRSFSQAAPHWSAVTIDAVSQFVIDMIFKNGFEALTN